MPIFAYPHIANTNSVNRAVARIRRLPTDRRTKKDLLTEWFDLQELRYGPRHEYEEFSLRRAVAITALVGGPPARSERWVPGPTPPDFLSPDPLVRRLARHNYYYRLLGFVGNRLTIP